MNITILGASAGVGLQCVQRALERKHKVTTLSRTIESMPENPALTCIKGSATDPAFLRKVVTGADAVIVALGTGSSIKATTLYTEAARALIQVQKELKTTVPFIVLTGFGAGNSGQYQGLVAKVFFKLLLEAVYKDKTRMEELIAASTLRWEIVRPGMLNNRPLSEKYRVETTYAKGMAIGSIARADVADFLVKQAENPTALGAYPALSTR
jgi:putative NADH-flavin reductase